MTMNTDKAVTAEFVRVFNLTTGANPLGGGVISPGGNTIHASGTEVTIIANPTDGYQFSEWGGDCTGGGACVVIMDADQAVTANFAPVFVLTTATDPADGGTVLPGGGLHTSTAQRQPYRRIRLPATASPSGVAHAPATTPV